MACLINSLVVGPLHLGADRGLAHFREALHLGGALLRNSDLGEGRRIKVRGSDLASVTAVAGDIPSLLRLPQLGADPSFRQQHDKLAGDF